MTKTSKLHKKRVKQHETVKIEQKPIAATETISPQPQEEITDKKFRRKLKKMNDKLHK